VQSYASRLFGVFAFFAVAVSLPIASTTYDLPQELGLRVLASAIGGMAVVSLPYTFASFLRARGMHVTLLPSSCKKKRGATSPCRHMHACMHVCVCVCVCMCMCVCSNKDACVSTCMHTRSACIRNSLWCAYAVQAASPRILFHTHTCMHARIHTQTSRSSNIPHILGIKP
jgi:hypothetical protein